MEDDDKRDNRDDEEDEALNERIRQRITRAFKSMKSGTAPPDGKSITVGRPDGKFDDRNVPQPRACE